MQKQSLILSQRYISPTRRHAATSRGHTRGNNGVQVDGIEALCIFFMRFAYPCRFADLVPTSGRPIPRLCMITNEVINFTYQRWGHLLSTLDQPWLSPYNLQLFADTVHSQGAPLANCWGFIYGTVRPVSRPGKNQRVQWS